MKLVHHFVLCIVMAWPLAAQQGHIQGRVIDQSTKQPLVGANIRVLGHSSGATTDLNGYYLIRNLAENVYKLQLDYIGYNSYVETDVRVVRDKTTRVKEIELIESTLQGEEITVVAGAFHENKQAPVSHYTYSKEEIIRNPGGSGDVMRAIETLPGVTSGGGEFSAFSVRGASPRDNIILIDNIPFTRTTHFDGGVSEEQDAQGGRFSIFTTGLVEEAAFQAGGFSARYGGKSASFVDIKIKEGNRTTPTVNGSFDFIGWEFNYDGPSGFHDRTGIVFSARHQDFTNILRWTGQKDLGQPRFSDFVLKTTTDINDRNKISLLGIYSPENFDRTIDHVYASDDKALNILADQEEQKYLIGLNWRFLTTAKSFWQNSFYFEKKDAAFVSGRVYTDPVGGAYPRQSEAGVRDGILTADEEERQVGWKSNFTYLPAKSLSTTFGFQVDRLFIRNEIVQNGLDTSFVFDRNDYRPDTSRKFIVYDPQYVNNTFSGTGILTAGFAECSYTLGEYVTFNPGVRWERSGFNDRSYWSPRFSVSYRLSPRTTLNLATGLYYQSPDMALLLRDAVNRNLKYEKAIHYMAGLTRYFRDDIKVSVEVYYKKLDDLIVLQDRTTGVRHNDGDGWARGLDLGVVKRFVGRWYGQVNYSYAQSRRNDHDGMGSYDSDFNQPHVFNMLIGYQPNKEWTFSAKWKYATGRPKDDYMIHENVLGDPKVIRYSKEITGNNTRRLDDFHTLNLLIQERTQFRRVALISYIDIVNVYNYQNVNEERFLERTGKVEKLGFRILPTGGFKLEF